MATVTYENHTKKIVELYSREKDPFGRDVERPMGFHLVYFADANNGGLAQGPYIEPNAFLPHDPETKDFAGAGGSTYPIDVIERRFVDNRMDGGAFGFWKHPNI